MRLKYDLDVGALYIRLSDGRIARTREVDDNTLIDLDADGGVIGIDVVSIAHPWPLAAILHDYAIPASEAAQLRAYFLTPTGDAGTALAREVPELAMNESAPAMVPA